MIKPEAESEAEYNAKEYGGIWHAVKLDGSYFTVQDAWFLQHKGIKSEYKTKEYYSTYSIPGFFGKSVPRIKWYRKVIRQFNRFLLWLLKPLIDARRNNRKA